MENEMMKRDIKKLAIFGGSPLFIEQFHVGRPNIGNQSSFLDRVNIIFDNRWLTNDGPFVRELEQKLSAYLGVRHVIAICNATVALEIAVRALQLRGEVIVPSFTFVATAHALQWQEITPVFCDIDPFTHNIDPNKVEQLITPRTTGILGVHVWGRACDVHALETIAQKYRLKLVFDAAHAFACSSNGRMIGGFADAEVFSFHATKFFNSFEGGAIATNNELLAKKIRDMRNFGFAGLDTVIDVGTNGKMSEVSAAMGLTSLESLDEFIAANERNYQAYLTGLEKIPGISMVTYNLQEKNNYQYIVLEVDEKIFGLSRDLLVKILHAENILARRYFYPGVHQMEPYRSYFPNARLVLPQTERLIQKVIQFPTGTAINKKDVERICDLIRFVFEHAQSIRDKLFYTSTE
jgi:dTDP-4-amino-4,6-dideoxygalactose transaminase